MKIEDSKLKMSSFAPANISCIFQIHKGKTPQTTGSTGVGFTLKEGVHAEVSFSNKHGVIFNGEKIDFPTVESVVRVIASETKQSHTSYLINLTSTLPLGSGFGISGASVLATAYALNDLVGLKKSKLELAKIAHTAEVENSTGLGDVTNQYFGGFLLKTEPSYVFKVHKLKINNIFAYCKVFSKLSTKSVVSDESQIRRINQAGEKAIRDVQRQLQECVISSELFSKIIQISKQFAKKSGLLVDTQVINAINEVESQGGHASMIMLGNAVFADIPFAGATKYTISK